jgi:rubrerythrin
MNDFYYQGYHGSGYDPVTYPIEAAYRAPVAQELIDKLAAAINAEYNAIHAYEALARLAPNQDFRTIITNIRNDEIGHFRNFSQYYAAYTKGRHPQLTLKPLPTSFRAGVEDSLRDELEDSKFYQETMRYTTDPRLLTILRDASADEARHATWFSYIWTKTGA